MRKLALVLAFILGFLGGHIMTSTSGAQNRLQPARTPLPEPTLPKLKPGLTAFAHFTDGRRPALDEELVDDHMLNYLKRVEGSKLDDSGNHIPYNDVGGGAPVVGYGHRIAKGEHEGPRTEEEAVEDLREDALIAAAAARSHVNLKFGTAAFEGMPIARQRALVDMAFNLGGGFGEIFPKFTAAMVNGDTEAALKEYKRYYTAADGTQHEMKHRNDLFASTFLADLKTADGS
jgi:GH24 family phage-related lysozyme (muramidase)